MHTYIVCVHRLTSCMNVSTAENMTPMALDVGEDSVLN